MQTLGDFDPKKENYHRGWLIIDNEKSQGFGHDGSAGTFYIQSQIFPEEEKVLCIASNCATENFIGLLSILRHKLN